MPNKRNQVAAKPRPKRKAAIQGKSAPGFPADVLIPQHSGASPILAEFPPPIPDVPVAARAQSLFAMPTPAANERLRPPVKRRKQARKGKPPAKPRKARTGGSASTARDGLAAFALPRGDEPLVTPAAIAPHVQTRALMVLRPVGLIDQIGIWLGKRSAALWDRLGGASRRDGAELSRLRAENARLKAQLDAFLALQQRPSIKTRARAPQPAS